MHTKGPGRLCLKGVMQMKKSIMLLLTLELLLGGCGSSGEIYIAGEETVPSVSPPSEENSTVSDELKDKETLWIYVCGAVNTPGVYELPAGSRVCHAVQAAGGMLANAESRAVNQAEELSDGQQITIPTVEETQEGIPSEESAQTGISADGKININTATLEELCTLTGIGETRAQAIMEYREQNGGFHSIEELMNIDGIKEKIFEKLREEVTVG